MVDVSKRDGETYSRPA